MKHVGKMKNNSARIAIAYRTIPDEPNSALVIGTHGLPDAYHDSLMGLIESEACQQANELADMLAIRRFPDGEVMLNWLHTRGHLKKVPTNLVLMTPNKQTIIQLDELNKVIAEQKGITLEELAVTDGKKESKKVAKKEEIVITEDIKIPESTDPTVVAKSYRSQADKLAKEAANFRRLADALDPPKKKAKAEKAEA